MLKKFDLASLFFSALHSLSDLVSREFLTVRSTGDRATAAIATEDSLENSTNQAAKAPRSFSQWNEGDGLFLLMAMLDVRLRRLKAFFETRGLLFSRQMSLLQDFRRLSPVQRHTFTAAFLGWTLDSLDFFLLIFCVKAISVDFGAKPSDVLSAVFLTQAFRPVGALLFGVLADRYGRRPVLMFNILCFSVIELACAFAPSLAVLLVLRALFGIAMGGEWGVGAALAFETLPKEGRGASPGFCRRDMRSVRSWLRALLLCSFTRSAGADCSYLELLRHCSRSM